MIRIRKAIEEDAGQVCEVFRASYGDSYTYPHYYDPKFIKKMIFSDDSTVFVAEDTDTGKILGTSSVIEEVGAYTDLISEFGRLTVHPDARGHHIGSQLMRARLDHVSGRNQVCLSETRITHPYSTRIGLKYGFVPLGFEPRKLLMEWRESAVLMVKHLGNALQLRRNHPRIIPEVHALASLCLRNVGLVPDIIVDDEAPAYPCVGDFDMQAMDQDGYTQLLRFERGRLKGREIFGPARLHYGFFKLLSRRSTYLVARRNGEIVGAVGFMRDDHEKQIRIFELIPLDDDVVRCLLSELVKRGIEEWGTAYFEVDVSAYAPRMQRTLIELGFVPAAYIPALTFHHVERLDIVKMVRVEGPLDWGPLALVPEVQEVAGQVIESLESRYIVPMVAQTMEHVRLFDGLTEDQSRRLAARCRLESFEAGDAIFHEGEPSEAMYLVLEGRIELHMGGAPLPQVSVQRGDVLGEVSMLGRQPHSATAVASEPVELAVLPHEELEVLIRRRPGLGLTLYRNLAAEVAGKLYQSDQALVKRVTKELYLERD
ncbi:MAG: GNAT family N-acetyltransferase [Rhodothermales bacterium]|nr:GNAT family N-acetyltransferase [Rhodothermales bacterium]